MINQTLGKKCCRDPFIFRDNEGVFHIIATDMKSDDGWANNNSMVVWDSDDLIHFTVVDKSCYSLDSLKPRHGSMLSINDEEYKRLVEFYGIEK